MRIGEARVPVQARTRLLRAEIVMADAGEAAAPAPRRLTVFGALSEGWDAQGKGSVAEVVDALAQLYPAVELTPAELKRMEKAKKFLEKKKQQTAAPTVSADTITLACTSNFLSVV